MWGSGCAMWIPRVSSTHFSPKHGAFGITDRTRCLQRKSVCGQHSEHPCVCPLSMALNWSHRHREMESTAVCTGSLPFPALEESTGFVQQEGQLGKCFQLS